METVLKMLSSIVILATICVFHSGYGQDLFNINTEMCCSQTVIPKPNDTSDSISVCCGHGAFNIQKELCCQNKTVALPAEAFTSSSTDQPLTDPLMMMSTAHKRLGLPILNLPHYACCGDTYFNYDTQLCCNEKTVKKPDAGDNEMLPTFWSCCGDQIYNVSSQDCCRGKILDKNSFSESCCGSQLIDNSKNICCFEDFFSQTEEPNILPRDNMDVGCCGKNKIDYKKELCCMNKVIPLPEDPTLRFAAICCGDKMWTAPSDEMCCNGEIVKRNSSSQICCDTALYSYETHMCCDGNILPRTTNTTFCCGKTPYEEATQACCYNSAKVIPLTDPAKRFCCE